MKQTFHLGSKLILFTFFSISLSLICAGFALDFVLKSLYSNKAWEFTEKSFDNLYQQIKEVEKSLHEHNFLISEDNKIIASINLINAYQDINNYQPLIFDEEKKKIADKLMTYIKPEVSKYSAVYDINGNLLAYAYKDKGLFTLGIVSYKNGKTHYMEKNERANEWRQASLQPYILDTTDAVKKRLSFTDHSGTIEHLSGTDHFKIMASKAVIRQYPDGRKKPIGVVKTVMHFTEGFLVELSAKAQAHFGMVLVNGFMLNFPADFKLPANFRESPQILGGKTVLSEKKWLNNKNYYARSYVIATQVGKLFIISLVPKRELLDALDDTRLTLLLIFVFTAILIIPLGIIWLTHRVSKPLQNLAGYARSIEKGHYQRFEHLNSNDEIGVLGRVFNRMINTIKQREINLLESEKNLNKAQEIAKLGSWSYDFSNAKWSISKQANCVLGIENIANLTVENFFKNVHKEDQKLLRSAFLRAVDAKLPFDEKYRIQCPDGTIKTIHSIAEIVEHEEGHLQLTGTSQDISELQAIQDKLEHLAQHDPLTGLANRLLFNDSLAFSIGRRRHQDEKLVVMFLDLDHFKDINDTMGHQFGDRLLKIVADKLKETVNQNDILARIGGDEFNLFIENIRDIHDARVVAEKILKIFGEPFMIDDQAMMIGMSIGISLFPDNGTSVVELVKNADTAMYKAKALGRNMYQFYSSEMTEQISKRMNLQEMIRQAIQLNSFTLYYQPQISLQSNRCIGVEALIRWIHPQQGFISPGEFIPLAEQTGLIVPIGDWVLTTALEQLKRWHQNGIELPRVSVNLSNVQLKQIDVPHWVEERLRFHEMESRHLELEITESYIMENYEVAVAILKKLQIKGIRFALDDFGTGYSSLNYLRKLPISKLKIDKSFIDDIPETSDAVAIVKTIVSLGKNLNLDVIAEGVESLQQQEYLRKVGCDQIQGYYTGRPMPAHDFETYYKKQAWKRAEMVG